jgi:2-polyprenyl-3-methyl-5-hydroxy-6-metoxy-1,4-benzoquinol methylase
MVQASKDSPTLDVTSFYDSLAGEYDTMTEFEKRFILEKPYYNLLVGRFKVKKALDAGCGTGFHSLLLSKLGVDVTAIDISKGMLHILNEHSRTLHLKVKALRHSVLKLPLSFHGSFDAVFCLGNTLPHLLQPEDIQTSFANFAAALKPKGGVIIQILNYTRILATKKEVQSTKRIGNISFIRSYQYEKDRIFFTIEKIEEKNGLPDRSIQTVELRPIMLDEITARLVAAGFEEIKVFGSMKLQQFDPELSTDLVVHARKISEEAPSA